MMPASLDVPCSGSLRLIVTMNKIAETSSHPVGVWDNVNHLSFGKHNFLICKTRLPISSLSSAHPSCYDDYTDMKRLYKCTIFVLLFLVVQLFVAISNI